MDFKTWWHLRLVYDINGSFERLIYCHKTSLSRIARSSNMDMQSGIVKVK